MSKTVTQTLMPPGAQPKYSNSGWAQPSPQQPRSLTPTRITAQPALQSATQQPNSPRRALSPFALGLTAALPNRPPVRSPTGVQTGGRAATPTSGLQPGSRQAGRPRSAAPMRPPQQSKTPTTATQETSRNPARTGGSGGSGGQTTATQVNNFFSISPVTSVATAQPTKPLAPSAGHQPRPPVGTPAGAPPAPKPPAPGGPTGGPHAGTQQLRTRTDAPPVPSVPPPRRPSIGALAGLQPAPRAATPPATLRPAGPGSSSGPTGGGQLKHLAWALAEAGFGARPPAPAGAPAGVRQTGGVPASANGALTSRPAVGTPKPPAVGSPATGPQTKTPSPAALTSAPAGVKPKPPPIAAPAPVAGRSPAQAGTSQPRTPPAAPQPRAPFPGTQAGGAPQSKTPTATQLLLNQNASAARSAGSGGLQTGSQTRAPTANPMAVATISPLSAAPRNGPVVSSTTTTAAASSTKKPTAAPAAPGHPQPSGGGQRPATPTAPTAHQPGTQTNSVVRPNGGAPPNAQAGAAAQASSRTQGQASHQAKSATAPAAGTRPANPVPSSSSQTGASQTRPQTGTQAPGQGKTPVGTQTATQPTTQAPTQASTQNGSLSKPLASTPTATQPAKTAAAGAGGAPSQPKPPPSSQTSSTSLSSTASGSTATSTTSTTSTSTTSTTTSTTTPSSRPSLHTQASTGHPKDVGRQLANPFTLLEEALEYLGPQRPLYQGTLTPDRMDAMDAHARACPASSTGSVAQLASYLSSAARSPEERVRAICFWLHLNVRYDTAAFFSGNVRHKTVDDVLRDRTSVCQGFAMLMCALCQACDIECEQVRGYAKGVGCDQNALRPEGPAYSSNHAWVAVRLYSPSQRDYSWFLVDPTWCSGYTNGTSWVQSWGREYYLPDPITLAQSHFPDDPKWTLLPEEKRPIWRGFANTVCLRFPEGWEMGIMPVTHKHVVVDVPPDGRLHMVFKARKGAAYMMAKLEGSSDKIYPSTLPRGDDSGAELLAFDFANVRPRRNSGLSGLGDGDGGGQPVTLTFLASPERYSTYWTLATYVLR